MKQYSINLTNFDLKNRSIEDLLTKEKKPFIKKKTFKTKAVNFFLDTIAVFGIAVACSFSFR